MILNFEILHNMKLTIDYYQLESHGVNWNNCFNHTFKQCFGFFVGFSKS